MEIKGGDPMKEIQAVIFDLDNTIIDRTSSFQSFAASMLEHYFNHEADHSQMLNLVMELDQDGYKDKRELFDELLVSLPWLNKPKQAELMRYYHEHYAKNAVLMENARAVIGYIRDKYKTAVITNGRNAIQYGKLDHLELRAAFDFIIVSEEAGYKKPDLRIFEAACTGLKLYPHQCLYVGDHPVNDIEGAWRAGMSTIWVKVNQPWREELEAKPLHTINRFDELRHIL
jgi:putative hydrolase of the HAD superfamily